MSRFFVGKDAVDTAGGRITITGEDVKHIRNVLRSNPGDSIELSDGAGMDYTAEIESLEKDHISAKITGSERNQSEPPVLVTLFQGVPKADKMDYIIQKCVELGINRIVPVLTERTVVRFDNARDAASKTARWQRIALEAAKQCDRGIVPEVCEPVRLDQALKLAEACDLRILPYEEETHGSLRKLLIKRQGGNRTDPSEAADGNKGPEPLKVAVFIGPEGGFAPNEAEKAAQRGFASVTLGPRILRTETAGIAVLSVIMYELGDLSMD